MRRSFVTVLAAAALLGGCADVKAWQKKRLADHDMAFEPDPLTARFRRHVYDSKEGAFGGGVIGGGGCGCG